MRLGEHRAGLDIVGKRKCLSAKKIKLIFLDHIGQSPFAVVSNKLRLLAGASV
jgi:hypothetical protein